MANNLNQSPYPEDEIDLREIFKILIESKKLIISTILIFTIASIIYTHTIKPSFITSAKLEIGALELSNGEAELIESSSNLISNLKILFLKQPENEFNHSLSINAIEGKVISLEITSSSAEHNDNLFTEIINFIEKRHSNLEKLSIEQKNKIILIDIENTKDEIVHYNSKLSDQFQSKYLNIISNLQKEEQASERLRLLSQNASNKDKVFTLNQKLATLIQDLENSNSKVKSKTRIISKIQTNEINKTQLIISLGIISGFVSSIFLVFINNFIKSYRKSEA